MSSPINPSLLSSQPLPDNLQKPYEEIKNEEKELIEELEKREELERIFDKKSSGNDLKRSSDRKLSGNDLESDLERSFNTELSEDELKINTEIHKKIAEKYESRQEELNSTGKTSQDKPHSYQGFSQHLKLIQIDNERIDRISQILAYKEDLDEPTLQKNLMWMTEYGRPQDFPFLLQAKKDYFKTNKKPTKRILTLLYPALKKCVLSLEEIHSYHDELLTQYRSYENEKVSDEFKLEIVEFVHQIEIAGLYLYDSHERFTAQSFLNYWITRLYRFGADELDLTLAAYDGALAPELKEADCPYVGLRPFKEEDHNCFSGRDRLIRQLIQHIEHHRLLTLVGPSKVGKSSLVFAGLLPQLKKGVIPTWAESQNRYYYPIISPGNKPLERLAQLVKPDAAPDWIQEQVGAFKQNSNHLTELISNHFYQQNVVVIIDALEELFTLDITPEDQAAFTENLLNFVEDTHSQNLLILTFSTEFEWKMTHHTSEQFQTRVSESMFKVDPLNREELKQVIETPAKAVGLRFDRGLVDTLIQDFSGQGDALPVLQVALLQLWKYRERDRITEKSYQQIGLGGGRLALANKAQHFYQTLNEKEQNICRLIFLRLARPLKGLEPTLHSVTRSELDKLVTPERSLHQIQEMLGQLVEENLVVKIVGKSEEYNRFSLPHESLVRHWRVLQDWINQGREDLIHRLRLTDRAQEWQEQGKNKSFLLQGEALKHYQQIWDLSRLEEEFIRCSQEEEFIPNFS
ncbi:MAG: ATP-binding protein [Planktothrix sp.]